MTIFRWMTALALFVIAMATQAGEAEVRAALAKAFPGMAIGSMTVASFDSDWYEVRIGGDILYVDKTGRHLIYGSIIDLTTRRNLTEERKAELSRIDVKTLPLASAIKRVQGNGSRTLVTFEDPYCGYCKKLNQELKKIKNLTIYTFLYPVISPDSPTLSKRIWCAPDRTKAWRAILDGTAAKLGSTDCKNPIESNLALGRRYQLGGVPALVFPDGTVLAGYRTAAEIESLLNAKSGKK